MSLRYSLGLSAAIVGMAIFAGPASAVMQVIHLPDPNAPVQNTPPDGLFDRSVPDSWQKKSTDGTPQNPNGFHFTVTGGASSGYGYTGAPSAYDTSKRAGSEFYQPLPGSQDPFYGQSQNPLFGH